MINIICYNAILCALAIFIGFFITDKNIKWLFLMYNIKNITLKFVDCLRFCFIYRLLHKICMLNSSKIIYICQNGFKLCPVAGRYLLECCRIFYIFDTELTKNNSPVCFRLVFIVCNDLFVYLLCFIKLTLHTKIVCTIKEISCYIISYSRNSLLCAAVFALAHSRVIYYFKISPTHFTFEC